ncbi:MAG: signal peptidase II [Elusimicrobia bacterium]|nr:signal peptidase II [Elusimicrobiota bacterium]
MRPAARLIEPLLVAGLFLADRLTKAWALRSLRPIEGIPVLPFFRLTYVENTGAAFGMGPRRNGLFIAVAAVLLVGLLYWRRRWPKENRWLQYGALLVIAGALGNLYDRIAYGFVVDFLDFGVSPALRWPAFNVADSCITVGAVCLAWGLKPEDAKK